MIWSKQRKMEISESGFNMQKNRNFCECMMIWSKLKENGNFCQCDDLV